MNILDRLRDAQGGAAIENLARTFELPPGRVEAVAREVMPELSYRMERNTLSRGGLADLIDAIGSGRHAAYAEDGATLRNPAVREEGNHILGHLMGTKASSRALAARAASTTGVNSTTIEAMLPYLAPMLMGMLSKSTAGKFSDILGDLPNMGGPLGRLVKQQQAASAGGLTLPGETRQYDAPGNSPFGTGGGFGGGGQDLGRDMGGGSVGTQAPLPLPDDRTMGRGGGRSASGGGDNPYGDLTDILRRGGSGSGTLWNILRSVLAGVLGFQSRGVVGWFVRMIVMRYGWRILQFFLGRLFRMR